MITRRHFGTLATALAFAATIPFSQAGIASADSYAQQNIPSLTAGHYQLQTISDPSDPTFTQLLGINSRKTIAGYFGSGQTVNGVLHPNKGFVLNLPNTYTPENYPNSVQTQVIGIDNRGDTGGFYIDQAGVTHGFLKMNGTYTTADLPGTTFNQILGLNNRGQAAGFFQDAAGQSHAYIREADGAYLVLPIANSTATGINDLGEVVGFTMPTSTTASGFILRGGHLTTLNVPGSTFTQAFGVNNLGQVVGDFTDAAGNMHGFVYENGTYRQVDEPGSTMTTLNGLNDAGDIVGFFVDGNGNTIGLFGKPQY
jgi:probable HAF family extracellular repeat protein